MHTELKLLRLVFTLHALLILLVLGTMLISAPARAVSAGTATAAATRTTGICTPALRDGVVCP